MATTTEDFAASRGRSFTDLWHVADDYAVRDGHVCALRDHQPIRPDDRTGAREYLPMARPELPGEVARMVSGRDADILRFVRRYGLFGYGQAWGFVERAGIVALHQNSQQAKQASAPGDPLPWVLAHARTVRLVIDLLGPLDDDAALQAVLDQLMVQDAAGNRTLEYLHARRGLLHPQRSSVNWRLFKAPRDLALYIIASILNENLTGVSRALIVEHDDGRLGFTSLFAPRNLLDCVYWHLADAAIGGWVRRCANPRCGAFFVAKTDRTKYCPPPIGLYGPDDEREPVSPCLARHKAQAWRDRQTHTERKARARARKGGRKR